MTIRKAIVTGANGFVGSALCKLLSSNGIDVLAVVRNKDSDITTIKDLENINIVLCELAHIGDISSVVLDRDIDVFFHFAWEGTSGPLRADEKVQIDNVKYSCDAVRACKTLGCKRFVYASSIMEHEIIDVMAKSLAPSPNEIYSTAKLCADYMGKIIATSMGIDYISGLISNTYGPGEYSHRLINTTLRKLLKGEHCSFSSGIQMYDFIYIEDAARAFYEIGENGLNGKSYYIGSSNPRPLREFLSSARDQIDPSIRLGFGEIEFRPTSLTYDELDIGALNCDTGFKPKFSFEEGIRRTIDWLKENDHDRV